MSKQPPADDQGVTAKTEEASRELAEARHQAALHLQAREEWRQRCEEAQRQVGSLAEENKSLQFWSAVFFLAAVIVGLTAAARTR